MRRNERINITVEEDLKAVMDSSRGLVKRSTYANHILRDYFVRQGLLPAAEEVQAIAIP